MMNMERDCRRQGSSIFNCMGFTCALYVFCLILFHTSPPSFAYFYFRGEFHFSGYYLFLSYLQSDNTTQYLKKGKKWKNVYVHSRQHKTVLNNSNKDKSHRSKSIILMWRGLTTHATL